MNDQRLKLDFSKIDVVELLEKMGVRNVSYEGQECRFSCPIPDAHPFGDQRPSAYMNRSTTAWTCHSCGASGNAITFISDVVGVPRQTAVRWIAERWAPEYADIDEMASYLRQFFAEVESEVEESHQVLDEIQVQHLAVPWVNFASSNLPCIEYMLGRRGFDPRVLEEMEVGFDDASSRVTLAVRDEDGQLVGFKGRAIQDDVHPKYLVLGDTERSIASRGVVYGFTPYDTGRFIYGLPSAEVIDGRLIPIEGELNCVAMRQHGFPESVGISGSTLTDLQVRLIAERCSEVVLLMDSDLRDEISKTRAQIKVARVVSQLSPYVVVRVCAQHEGDPAEMTREQLAQLVDHAESSTARVLQNLLAH